MTHYAVLWLSLRLLCAAVFAVVCCCVAANVIFGLLSNLHAEIKSDINIGFLIESMMSTVMK